MSHFSRDLSITLVAGLVSLAVNWFVAQAGALRFSSTGPAGFPFPIRYVNPIYFGPGGPVYAYDLLELALDGAFWAGLTLVIVTLTDWIITRFGSLSEKARPNKSRMFTIPSE